MFCLLSPSKCVELLQLWSEDKVDIPDSEEHIPQSKMHSSEGGAKSTPLLLDQLGRLIIRARPATSYPPVNPQIQSQEQRCEDYESCALDDQLNTHVQALCSHMEPLCIEVLLAPDCVECSAAPFSRIRHSALLLERWTITTHLHKSTEQPAFINPQWLLNAVRSQLHFSQLSAWLATLQPEPRRKLSREQCNYKKVEAKCDEAPRKLNIVYSINADKTDFTRPPTEHTFPLTDVGNDTYLNITLQSLPRIVDIPTPRCPCQKIPEELVGKLNDLTISKKLDRLSDGSVLDDRMHTPCSESGKHRCCDDESDHGKRRLKEIAKHKRRLRKEKMRQLCESTSSEDGRARETTSIPILQAARFDRLRALGCYRARTYLTLPASRLETRSPFVEADFVGADFGRTRSVGTQTDGLRCECGNDVRPQCDSCRGPAGAEDRPESGARRKLDEPERDHSSKKHKCDNSLSSFIKRPKEGRRLADRLEQIARERSSSDIKELHLSTDDSVFSAPKESKRQKTFSISDDDYVLYEKCDYGTIDRHELESPKEEVGFKFALPHQEGDGGSFASQAIKEGFVFPEPRRGHEGVPSPSEVDKFRWRFDSAASMVFHTRTGLPLTSSPAPLRRGNNCFDFDDSINGISGIKSALFHPISPVSEAPPSPASPPAVTLRPKRAHRLKIPPSTGLLGSFEESALQGRLEAVATVHGFTAELGASGAFCPPHKRLPVTVFFYAPGGTNAPYMGHINLGPQGYRVSRSGTVQVSLFNPHGTLVKMWVVLYDLTAMPAGARTFLRQRTLYMPAHHDRQPPAQHHAWLRYLIHLRFMTSKSGKLYLHTDIRLIVSRKADLDTATAHSALYRPIPTKHDHQQDKTHSKDLVSSRSPNRVFGGCSESESEFSAQDGVSYELRSFTYAPENPKYSPR